MAAGEIERAEPLRARKGPVWWVGLALVVAGTAVSAYVVWQLYGTTWLSQRDQRDVVAATERAWSTGARSKATEDDRARTEDVVALVRIPAFGDDYVVPAYDGITEDVLARGFGITAGSPAPGGIGNLVLSGHRITHGEPLRQLPDLRPGDRVTVETQDAIYTYVLDTEGDGLSVDMTDTWVTQNDPQPPGGGPSQSRRAGSKTLLTLVTCAELFHTDERLVAFAHLVDHTARD